MVHRQISLGDFDQEGPSALGSEDNISPPARDLGTVGQDPQGVVDTILNSRAPSTWKLLAS